MRPRSLTIDGIAAYRQKTEVPIGDANLFALVGPTGSGKSSVLDAICLVLYGTVPRLGDRRKLAPALTTGRDSATIEFTFDVGAATYRTVRVLKRTKTGATTKEAVFERIDPATGDIVLVLAESVSDFPKAVMSVIGLDYDDFTKVVMLPQGDFAAMLKTDAGKRRAMLIDMLGLGIYEQVMQAANQERAAADGRLGVVADEQQRLVGITADTVSAANAAVDGLQALLDMLTELTERKTEAEGQLRTARQEHDTATQHRDRVTGLPVCPDDVRQLTEDIDAADGQIDQAAFALEEAKETLVGVEVTAEQTREQATIAREQQSTRTRLDQLQADADRCDVDATNARTAADQAAAQAVVAADALPAKQVAADRARRTDAAAHAAVGLHAGDECPVCARTLNDTPELQPDPDLVATITAADDAAQMATGLQSRAETLATTAESAADNAATANTLLVEETERAGEVMDNGSIAVALAADATAVAAAKATRTVVTEHERLHTGAVKARKTLDTRAAQARATLDTLRVGIGDPACPSADGPIAVAWDTILVWAADQAQRRQRAVDTTRHTVEQAAAAVTATTTEMADAATAAGFTPTPNTDIVVATGSALGRESAKAEQMAKDLSRGTALAEEVVTVTRRRDVMSTVADLCRTNKIREWLLEDAILRLVDRATEQLQVLSSGRYEMTYTDGDFTICDLFEGAATRPIRSLSGGETFLVSLALALALGEEIAANSTATVRSESLFIDEGFGTLDPERLDLVAEVLETLGASRVIGIVTHVPEIAERLPVRIEVTAAAPGGSPTLIRHDV